MSCVKTDKCNYIHCTDCPHYEIGNLTTKDQSTAIGTVRDVIEMLEDGNNNLDALLKKERAEVAREIFEAIEPVFMSFCLSLEAYTAWQNLKNKYTEGK